MVRLGFAAALLLLGIGMVGAAEPDPAVLEELKQLNAEGNSAFERGNYSQALEVSRHAVVYAQQQLKADDPALARAFYSFTRAAVAKGNYAMASPPALRALTLREQILGPEHPDVADSLNQVATIQETAGAFAAAEPLITRALAIQEKVLGPESPAVAESLSHAARLSLTRADYPRAESALQRSLRIRETILGAKHPDTAQSLVLLGELRLQQADYAAAEKLLVRALTIQRQALSHEHPALATSLNDLSAVYLARGDYAQAEPLCLQALAVAEKSLGSEHPQIAAILDNLAALSEARWDTRQAESLRQRAVAILAKTLGAAHPDIAVALSRLAELYRSKGDYIRAAQLHKQAEGIWSKAVWTKAVHAGHPDLAVLESQLGMLELAAGATASGKSRLDYALNGLEQSLGPEHPAVAVALTNLAIYHMVVSGDDANAESLLQRSSAITEKHFGPEHFNVAATLPHLASIAQRRGDTARAESLDRRALAAIEKHLGSEHPMSVGVLNHLATLSWQSGDIGEAVFLYMRSTAIQERRLDRDLATGSEAQKLAAMQSLAADTHQILSLHLEGNLHDTNAARLALTTLLQRKGRVLDTLSGGLAVLRDRLTDKDRASFEQLLAVRTGLSKEAGRSWKQQEPQRPRTPPVASGPEPANLIQLRAEAQRLRAQVDSRLRELQNGQPATPEDRALMEQWSAAEGAIHQYLITELPEHPMAQLWAQVNRNTEHTRLESEADRLEARISSRVAEFRSRTATVTLEQVQRALPDGSALVELVLYKPFNPSGGKPTDTWGRDRYAAYVLLPHGEPRVAILGDADVIQQTVEALRATLRSPARRPRSRAVRGKAVVLGPVGANTANPARILDDQLMRPIRDLLGHTRTIFFSPDGAVSLVPIGALLDAHGHYLTESYSITYLTSGRDLLRAPAERENAGDVVVLGAPDFGNGADLSPGTEAADRGRRASTMTRDTLQFSPLPGTAKEASAIAALFKVRALTFRNATESTLKQIHRPRILHIATHGFFLPSKIEQLTPSFAQHLARDPARQRAWINAPDVENPLLRSGLALAGANRLQSGSDDGILTALEASGLDLWGTQLVVLSACETGVGKVQNGEGVYGLRRALVNAGAETQMMSLWKVDDAATRDLMVDYYRRLKAGEGRSEALRQAQLSMLHSNSRSDPYYWASFIVSGDWRKLKGLPSGSNRGAP